MAAIHAGDTRVMTPDLTVTQPRQRRTREQWERVLDAGVQLLEDGGYEAFTIAALCERAGVPPRALYARAATKDALFLAVYERGMSRVLASHDVFREPDRWSVDDEHRVEQAVRHLVSTFAANAAFLRSVVLISGAHPEVRRRGESYRGLLGELFVSVLGGSSATAAGDNMAGSRHFLFSVVFSVLVVQTAYGPGFGPDGGEEATTRELVTLAERYLQT